MNIRQPAKERQSPFVVTVRMRVNGTSHSSAVMSGDEKTFFEEEAE
ncbi:hypothetical protein O205_19360 [Bacillus amyloliquefaciens EGD-AQ14]|nr:hypothetical protein O205_19360 [Bacillus amyloliquefaciens EGD-AQ14]